MVFSWRTVKPNCVQQITNRKSKHCWFPAHRYWVLIGREEMWQKPHFLQEFAIVYGNKPWKNMKKKTFFYIAKWHGSHARIFFTLGLTATVVKNLSCMCEFWCRTRFQVCLHMTYKILFVNQQLKTRWECNTLSLYSTNLTYRACSHTNHILKIQSKNINNSNIFVDVGFCVIGKWDIMSTVPKFLYKCY